MRCTPMRCSKARLCKRSIANDAQPAKGKKPRKAAAGQKEMLLPISGKRATKEDKKKVGKSPARARKGA